ncbi:MAG: 3'-5' exoribonuclease [Kiritimatiellae bacterium]|nr:3'-5' exoribonuclease [Kiritimatiellia bacterium]
MNMDGWHVMVDLETLGRKPGCVIHEIGVVAFQVRNGRVGSFDANEPKSALEWLHLVDIESCQSDGLTIDAATLKWALLAKRDLLGAPDERRLDLREALELLDVDVQAVRRASGNKLSIWGNGASFDMPILEAAYKVVGRTPPWFYWEERCFRTFAALYADLVPWDAKAAEHGALADARRQVAHIAQVLLRMP